MSDKSPWDCQHCSSGHIYSWLYEVIFRKKDNAYRFLFTCNKCNYESQKTIKCNEEQEAHKIAIDEWIKEHE